MRAWIYDALILRLTSAWYRAVLERVPVGSRVLDVGIGTGGALAANAALVRERRLEIVGVDIDADYVARCLDHVTRAGLANRVEVRLETLSAHRAGGARGSEGADRAGRRYDAIYFSGSFMLMDDPVRALAEACSLLAPGGAVYFTQTFEKRRSPLLERAKPLLRKLTTIDFGRVTYEDDFRRVLAAGAVELEALDVIGGNRRRSYVLARAYPRPAA